MNTIFAKRRARLLAMKAIRDNYIPGDQLVACPGCGRESQRKDVSEGLSVCPLCGYHFPIGAYYRLSTILDPGSFREAEGRPAEDGPQRGRRHRHRDHQRTEMRGGRAGQPLFHGQHERGGGGEDHPGH